ncbi:MAG: TlyA family RNA methyltransferase [Synergistaceae bacterium]|nr:TlyA family RNA methyltransferase [Synergistaceae bacterium]
MKNRERLDKLLPELGLVDTRNKAQALIMSGKVRVNNQVVTKSGAMFSREDSITLDEVSQWASRGAKKLLRAFEVFDISVSDKICADFGASTGGFTDVLLANGASKVYAIDVGYGQLLWRLASDSRVIVMDRTNARYLTREDFADEIDFASCDVSFISLRLILPVIDSVVKDDGSAVVLIKPQFEAGRDKISKGVVRDRKVHSEVLDGIIDFIEYNTGFVIAGLTHSPITGPEGNIEFLCRLTRDKSKSNKGNDDYVPDVNKILDEAYNFFER